MKRRSHLKAILGMLVGFDVMKGQSTARKNPIQLFVEMEVEPQREQEMLHNFHDIFLPEAKKHAGYISIRMLKLAKVVQGPPPSPAANYRFELVFESEELRQKWIASPEHKRVWPTVERTMKNRANYQVLLFDEV
jgi:hypothetical protein